VDRLQLLYAPRAQRDLLLLERRFALQILEDLTLLETPPWPLGKVKRLSGTDFWEIKSGDYRTIFWPVRGRAVVLRLVNRRDLERSLGRIDLRALVRWLRAQRE
jgi:mRNA-degrading endonuclease RelE of RelBE toxin-antitoxin system